MPTPLRLLMVAEQEVDESNLVSALQSGGYELTHTTVSRLEDLRTALDEQSWDLVLVIYPLNQLRSFDAVGLVAARRTDLPCIVVSGERSPDAIVAAMKVGARDFIAKELGPSSATPPPPDQTPTLRWSYPRLIPAIRRELRETKARRTRQQAAAETRRKAATAEALVRIAARLNARLELATVTETICEEAVNALQMPAAGVLLYDARRDSLSLMGQFGLPNDVSRRLIAISRPMYEILTQQPLRIHIIPNAQTDLEFAYREDCIELGIQTLAVASMMREGELVGLLALMTFEEAHEFSTSELSFLQGLADLAAQAISHARVFEQAERRLAHMRALHTIDLAISSSLDMRLTLNVLLEQALMQLDVNAADVLLLDENSQILTFAAGRGFKSSHPQQVTLRLGYGLAGRAALARQPLHIPNLLQVTNDLLRMRWLREEGFNTQYVMPLIAKGQVKGVLEIFNRAPIDLDDEWLSLIEALAGHAAIAIDNAALFDKVQRSNQELTIAYEATLEGWSRALDLRDRETEGHSQRVANMALRMARELGGSADDMVHIRRGALLHDIGKMGVSDTILLKPGPLDEDEMARMRKHPELAYSMLAPIDYLRPALDIPYCHHEKWDGSGYPRGLMGELIPLSARIFAVVDVYDALRSDRPYRRAWPERQVRTYLENQAGTHFEPRLVETFMRAMERA